MIWYKRGEEKYADRKHARASNAPFPDGSPAIAARVCDYVIHGNVDGTTAVPSADRMAPKFMWVGPTFETPKALIDYIGRKTINIKFFTENNWKRVSL